MSPRPTRGRDAGSALLLVLWISLFLALVLAAVAALVQSRLRVAGLERSALLADEALLSALDVAAFDIALTGPVGLSDLPRTIRIGGQDIAVTLGPSQALLDINMADADQWSALLVRLGTPEDQAAQLADHILDWRDNDIRPRARGGEADAYADGAGQPPANRPFLDVRELRHVRGVTPDLLDCLAPYVTTLGGTPEPQTDAGLAPGMRFQVAY